jgi:hypothetical protein
LKNLIIITPVKDSIEIAQQSIKRVCESKGAAPYWVYNDYSTSENRKILEEGTILGYTLLNIEDITDTPSPNYRFTLIDAQKKARESHSHILLVESDVYVNADTISKLLFLADNEEKCGMVAAITVDEDGEYNFPYQYIPKRSKGIVETRHRVSFCCTLISNRFLNTFDFSTLSTKKDWYDVQISKVSRTMGFRNLIDCDLKVRHLPHSSRPWKKLKYEKPLTYYFRKFFKRLDRI